METNNCERHLCIILAGAFVIYFIVAFIIAILSIKKTEKACLKDKRDPYPSPEEFFLSGMRMGFMWIVMCPKVLIRSIQARMKDKTKKITFIPYC